jgi:hypothetical protein
MELANVLLERELHPHIAYGLNSRRTLIAQQIKRLGGK